MTSKAIQVKINKGKIFWVSIRETICEHLVVLSIGIVQVAFLLITVYVIMHNDCYQGNSSYIFGSAIFVGD